MRASLITAITAVLCVSGFLASASAQSAASATPVSYSLLEIDVSESSDDKLDSGLIDSTQVLYGPPVENLVISDTEIRSRFEGNLYDEIGRVVECEKFSRKCLIIRDLYKLALGDNFSFENTSTWEWEDFVYVASFARRMVILGQPVDVVEVSGQSKEHPSIWVSFLISRDMGVIYFKLNAGGFVQTYILGSEQGLWAVSK